MTSEQEVPVWIEHDGGPRPLHPGTKIIVWSGREFHPALAPVSPVELASSVNWSLRPGWRLRYRVVGKSAEEIAAELRVRDAAPELLEALQEMWDSSCTNATSTPSKAAFLKARSAIAASGV